MLDAISKAVMDVLALTNDAEPHTELATYLATAYAALCSAQALATDELAKTR